VNLQALRQDWETTFATWAQPPGQTEQARIENAIRAVRTALDDDERLGPVTRVFPQGSYRNRVNVGRDSDVDVGVLYIGNVFYPAYPPGMTDADFGNITANYGYAQFKAEVGQALVRRFGVGAVTRGNKAFDVHENTYRLDADVVPVFVHRRYARNGSFICGVQLNPDNGGQIVNWPERLYDDPHWPRQHYENAVAKNTATGRSYKGVVRILKTLRNAMDEAGSAAARPICGFFVECLVWNAPNGCFGRPTWDQTVQAVLSHLWANTQTEHACADWREVSELKYLFRGSPDLKRVQAHAFLDAAWHYVGVRP
jgi:hypothetical protein